MKYTQMKIELDRVAGTYSNGKAFLDRNKNDSQECTYQDNEIIFVNLPNVISSWNINEASHCSHYDCTQYNIWGVLEQWH